MTAHRIGLVLALAALPVLAACGGEGRAAASEGPIVKGGDDRNGEYTAVADWWKPAPDHDSTWTWGEVSGLAVDNPNRIIVAVWGDRDARGRERPKSSNYMLVVDSMGGIWVGTNGGLNRLEPGTGIVRRWRHDPQDPTSLSDDRIRAVFEDATGTIWVGTHKAGLNRLRSDGAGFDRFRHDPAQPGSNVDDRVRAILEDSSDRLWIATDGNSDADTGRSDGLWALETQGEACATSRLFFRCPAGAELCGPEFTPDNETLFVAVQHPGAGGPRWKAFGRPSTFEDPSTRWPDFAPHMPPRPSVLAITRRGGGRIGT